MCQLFFEWHQTLDWILGGLTFKPLNNTKNSYVAQALSWVLQKNALMILPYSVTSQKFKFRLCKDLPSLKFWMQKEREHLPSCWTVSLREQKFVLNTIPYLFLVLSWWLKLSFNTYIYYIHY